MHTEDVKNLSRVVERPGMYLLITDQANIVSFINGYEYGLQGRCQFTNELSRLLTDKYGIKCYATGWSNQIKRYSESKSVSWVEAFFSLSSEILLQDHSF